MTAVAVLAGLVLGFVLKDSFITRGSAQSPAGGEVGRYQALALNENQYTFVVLDTKMGRCWRCANTNTWTEISPEWAKKP